MQTFGFSLYHFFFSLQILVQILICIECKPVVEIRMATLPMYIQSAVYCGHRNLYNCNEHALTLRRVRTEHRACACTYVVRHAIRMRYNWNEVTRINKDYTFWRNVHTDSWDLIRRGSIGCIL